ncbi:sigma-w pathway protein ysdB [Virgibacillus phasianinus]|uniref:Sigma-w pathway protein ysdB n=1 Tax=Virgibacillus phasianinus TaxID=2017483 RepID=A0A220U4G9_9BACI|nr:sigma-w pathway protein ysdB [Virgibacillus phasianinus]ASK63007.1 sigma-w pathway protein ysdB [Virgibacillus phasianinus]
MIIILFRILIVAAIILLVYTFYQYYRNPKRKLHIAKANNEFYFLDEPDNSKKNLLFVYKGCSFEGEKYLGTTEQAFEVVNIHVFVHEPMELKGFTRDDLYFLEKEILTRYPYSKIEWKHPVNELVLTPIE